MLYEFEAIRTRSHTHKHTLHNALHLHYPKMVGNFMNEANIEIINVAGHHNRNVPGDMWAKFCPIYRSARCCW